MAKAMTSLSVLFTLSLALLCICEADLISNVCTKSRNPALCTKTLRSDPRARRTDLRGMGQVIIIKAKLATRNVIFVAKSIGGGTSRTCVETSVDAIVKLDECAGYLKKSDRSSVSSLQTKGSLALKDVRTCDDKFGIREPAILKAATKKAQDIIDVLVVIAKKL